MEVRDIASNDVGIYLEGREKGGRKIRVGSNSKWQLRYDTPEHTF